MRGVSERYSPTKEIRFAVVMYGGISLCIYMNGVAQELLALGATVIIEWGTWARSERDTLRVRARELGAAVELHYLSAPLDVLFERIQRRGMEDPPIEREALGRWSEMFEAPTPEETALFDRNSPP